MKYISVIIVPSFLFLVITLICFLASLIPKPQKICEEHIYTVTKLGQCELNHGYTEYCVVMLDNKVDVHLSHPSIEGAKLRKCNGIYERVK